MGGWLGGDWESTIWREWDFIFSIFLSPSTYTIATTRRKFKQTIRNGGEASESFYTILEMKNKCGLCTYINTSTFLFVEILRWQKFIAKKKYNKLKSFFFGNREWIGVGIFVRVVLFFFWFFAIEWEDWLMVVNIYLLFRGYFIK